MKSRTIASIGILATAFAGMLTAQITGHVKGTVVDATQSSVASAQLTITSAETGESRQQTADGEGRFAFNQLKCRLDTFLLQPWILPRQQVVVTQKFAGVHVCLESRSLREKACPSARFDVIGRVAKDRNFALLWPEQCK